LREGQRARESPERALDPVVALGLLLVLSPALAGEREDVVLDLDRDVVLLQARQVGPQDEALVGLDQVDVRHPATGADLGAAVDAVDLGLKRVKLSGWIPAY